MKGYFTVRVTAPRLSQGERIVLETAYVRVLDKLAGGHDHTVARCLAAASESDLGPQRAWLRQASDTARAAVEAELTVPADCSFSIQAWQARDL